MENKLIKIPSYIKRIQTMADKGLRLYVDTNELSPEDKAMLMGLHEKFGYFVFAEQAGAITETEIKNLPEIQLEKDEKSPSQILKSRMFVYFKEKHNSDEGFYNWYASTLDKIGQTYLDKLN